jgi:hypothetical protein
MVKEIKDVPSGSDSKGALENEVEKIEEIVSNEVLGYDGEAREEHTGESTDGDEDEDEGKPHFADNAPEQILAGTYED